jgi:hypothetical protein
VRRSRLRLGEFGRGETTGSCSVHRLNHDPGSRVEQSAKRATVGGVEEDSALEFDGPFVKVGPSELHFGKSDSAVEQSQERLRATGHENQFREFAGVGEFTQAVRGGLHPQELDLEILGHTGAVELLLQEFACHPIVDEQDPPPPQRLAASHHDLTVDQSIVDPNQ